MLQKSHAWCGLLLFGIEISFYQQVSLTTYDTVKAHMCKLGSKKLFTSPYETASYLVLVGSSKCVKPLCNASKFDHLFFKYSWFSWKVFFKSIFKPPLSGDWFTALIVLFSWWTTKSRWRAYMSKPCSLILRDKSASSAYANLRFFWSNNLKNGSVINIVKLIKIELY